MVNRRTLLEREIGGGGGAPAEMMMDMPIMHDSDRYELVKDIGSGNFGVARLMRDKKTNELVAVKYIERGEKVSVNLHNSTNFLDSSAL